MGLVLKHIERTRSGSFNYRRRVPKDVAGIISKREFKKKLGETETEALRHWPQFHAQVEREIAQARKRLAAGALPQTEREAYEAAQNYVQALLPRDASADLRDITADSVAGTYRIDPETDAPLNASAVDRHTINILRSGSTPYPAPQPTLNEALKLYLKEHLHADGPDADSRVSGLARRVVQSVIDTMGSDPALAAITRDDARRVRDNMLDRVKMTGRGVGGKVSAATVSRELSILSAIINYARTEFGIAATVSNAFSGLPVKRAAKGQGQKDSEKRDPLPPEVLTKTRNRIIANAAPDLSLIWRLIEGTGCRIAEVTGLRVADVQPNADFPHVRIEPNQMRRLKSESSRRAVPLVGDALKAAKEALALPRTGDMLFPKYGRPRGSDAASAALMKHLRAVSDNEKHVIHSLRHNMKDRLILAEASSTDQNMILGHAMVGVGERVYGGEVARLRKATEVMKAAAAVKIDRGTG